MTILRQYQKQGVLQIEHWGGKCLLADEQGLGKTIQALTYLRRNPTAAPAVAVCPASVKFVWEIEAAQHTNIRAQICNGIRPPPMKGLRVPAQLYIVNYDILHKWVDWLLAAGVRCVIFDEVQNICNPTTIRGKAARRLCAGLQAAPLKHVLGLSGTPLMNRPIELWHILNLIAPAEYPSQIDFGFQYCEPRYVRGKWQYKGAVNIPHLHKRLVKRLMIRRLKQDVLKELPPKTIRVVPLPLTDPAQYRAAQDDFKTWVTVNHPAAARRALYNQALTQLGYLLRLAAQLKLAAVEGWVDDWLAAGDAKIIIFYNHRAIGDALYARYKKFAVKIDGGTNLRHRRDNIIKFQNDKRCRVILGNKAMISGVTLTAASTVAFAEYYWRPADHLQASDRPHRIGQVNPVDVNFLTAIGTIEEKLAEINQRKQGVLRGVLDGGGGTPLNVYDLLLQAIAEGQ